jgi:ferredoxin-NADP reductase
LKLTRIEEVATGTLAYYFERPVDFAFTPGQFVEVTLATAAEPEAFHSFSIASAPCEPELMIATRNRESGFKQAMRLLATGTDVQIDGPYGRFVLLEQHAGTPHVFIAGGIGITPFRSIVTQSASDGTSTPLLLFHANRDVAGAPFQEEMLRLQEAAPSFRFVPTLTRPGDGWQGERGYVDAAMISRYVEPQRAIYYVSGPPAMVASTRAMLAETGIANSRILYEAFEGY